MEQIQDSPQSAGDIRLMGVELARRFPLGAIFQDAKGKQALIERLKVTQAFLHIADKYDGVFESLCWAASQARSENFPAHHRRHAA